MYLVPSARVSVPEPFGMPLTTSPEKPIALSESLNDAVPVTSVTRCEGRRGGTPGREGGRGGTGRGEIKRDEVERGIVTAFKNSGAIPRILIA